MANRYYSEHTERKISGGGARPSPGHTGTPGASGPVRETTATWNPAGASGGSVFASKRFPVVKTNPVRKGC